MKRQATVSFIATMSLALAACSGPADEPSLASRIAREATRTVVNAAIAADGSADGESRDAPPADPLRVAASRPNAILADPVAAPDPAGGGSTPVTGHVVTSSVVADMQSKCEGTGTPGSSATSTPCASLGSSIACPLSRAKSGNLTRI